MGRTKVSDGGDDIWWYVCKLCNQAFSDSEDTPLKTLRCHSRMIHNSNSAANTLILSQTTDLQVKVKIVRCSAQPKRRLRGLRDATSPLSRLTRSTQHDASRSGKGQTSDNDRLAETTKDNDTRIPAHIPLLPTTTAAQSDCDRDSHVPGTSSPQLKKEHISPRTKPRTSPAFKLGSNSLPTNAHLDATTNDDTESRVPASVVELVCLPEPRVIIKEDISMESETEDFHDPLHNDFEGPELNEDSHSGSIGEHLDCPEDEIDYLGTEEEHWCKPETEKDKRKKQERGRAKLPTGDQLGSIIHNTVEISVRRQENGSIRYYCTICNASAHELNLKHLKYHIRREHDATPCTCLICDGNFSHLKELEQHIKQAHAEEIDYWSCEKCKTLFRTEVELAPHNEALHTQATQNHLLESDHFRQNQNNDDAETMNTDQTTDHDDDTSRYSRRLRHKPLLRISVEQESLSEEDKGNSEDDPDVCLSDSDESEQSDSDWEDETSLPGRKRRKPINTPGAHRTSSHIDIDERAHYKFNDQESAAYRCGICWKGFGRPEITENHMASEHANHLSRLARGEACDCLTCYKDTFLRPSTISKGGWDCKLCQKAFAERDIKKHIDEHHPAHKLLDNKAETTASTASSEPSEWLIAKRGQALSRLSEEETTQAHPTLVHEGKSKAIVHICRICKQEFPGKASLRHHEAEVHDYHRGSKMQCKSCDMKFAQGWRLRQHEVWHTNERRFRCDHPECDKAFNQASHLRRHRIIHLKYKEFQKRNAKDKLSSNGKTRMDGKAERQSEWKMAKHARMGKLSSTFCDSEGETRYECLLCGKSYSSRKRLRSHVSEAHNPNLILQCSTCQKEFSTKKGLQHHKKNVHATSRDYVCSTCGGTYKSAHELRTHMLYHDESNRTHVCDICSKAFFTNSGLHTHKKSHNTRDIMCPVCGQMFKCDRDLKFHHRNQHTDIRRFKCDKCDASFKILFALKRHAVVHMESMPFPCSQCPKAFKMHFDLKTHTERVHEKKRKAVINICRICKQEFPGRVSLQRHEIQVHDFVRSGKKLQCKFCDKKFSQGCSLRQHEVSHTNERRFKCDHPGCDKAFQLTSHLRTHRFSHLTYEELPHVCDICQKRFGQASQLRNHKRRIHDKEKAKLAKSMDTEPAPQVEVHADEEAG